MLTAYAQGQLAHMASIFSRVLLLIWIRSLPGHAAVAAGLANGLSILWPQSRTIFMNVAAAVASTRVITGDHFLSDALAGFAVGRVAAGFCGSCFIASGIAPFDSTAGGDGNSASVDPETGPTVGDDQGEQ